MHDPWSFLKAKTSARIALGRAGGSLPTQEALAFRLAHAAARDAVHLPFDDVRLAATLKQMGLATLGLASRAGDQTSYLARPDLGRRLDDGSVNLLRAHPSASYDIAMMIAGGLSPQAAHEVAPSLIGELVTSLTKRGFSFAPLCTVRFARVAIEDEIGSLLKARVALILIGERPGLGNPTSLGAYLVYEPRLGRTDAERNCVSNIRPGGLGVEEAVRKLTYLTSEALRRGLSGVQLKDQSDTLIEESAQGKGPLPSTG